MVETQVTMTPTPTKSREEVLKERRREYAKRYRLNHEQKIREEALRQHGVIGQAKDIHDPKTVEQTVEKKPETPGTVVEVNFCPKCGTKVSAIKINSN